MIDFKREQANEQYISIRTEKGKTNELLQRLINKHNSINGRVYKVDETEILLNLPSNGENWYKFSLNQLAESITQISKQLDLVKPVKLAYVIVNFKRKGQRNYLLNHTC